MSNDRHELQAAIILAVSRWPADAQVTWHERAAMREYAANMDRKDAERFAYFEVKRAMEGRSMREAAE